MIFLFFQTRMPYVLQGSYKLTKLSLMKRDDVLKINMPPFGTQKVAYYSLKGYLSRCKR